MHGKGGGMCGEGGVHGRGACMAEGGMHGRGVCVANMPPPKLRDTVGQCAGSTHPTGMHSC